MGFVLFSGTMLNFLSVRSRFLFGKLQLGGWSFRCDSGDKFDPSVTVMGI